MNAKYSRFCANPHAAAAMVAEAEREEAGAPAPEVPAPKAATAMALEDRGGKWEGPCPACREDGKDNKGNHLIMFPDGAWGCTVNRGEAGKEHRRRMMELAPELRGGKGSGPARPRVSFEEEKAAISEGLLALWGMIKEKLWCEVEDLPRFLGEGAPVPSDLAGSLAVFCKAFRAGDWSWIGNRHDQNEEEWGKLPEDKKKWQSRFLDHLFDPTSEQDRARMVAMIAEKGLDHASGRIFLPTASGRSEDQSCGLRFRIVEHDKDGGEPTPLGAQLAAIRYASEVLGWKLLWIMKTGGKGVHGAFDTASISPMQLDSDIRTLKAIGCDPHGLDHGATRCPGAMRRTLSRHQKPKTQALVWVSKEL